jgi:UrcA family protein
MKGRIQPSIKLFGEATMNKHIKPLAFILALTIPAISSAEVTSSQLAEDEVLITFNAEDAATSYGRTELELQIHRAAEKVCGSQNRSRAGSMKQVMANRSCYKEAVAEALSSISSTG